MTGEAFGGAARNESLLALKRFGRRLYFLISTTALLMCFFALISSYSGWLRVGWTSPHFAEPLRLGWVFATWMVANAGEIIKVCSFALLAWALFMAAMKMDTIFNIVQGFNEARSPISQLQNSVQGIKGAVSSVRGVADKAKESADEFNRNLGALTQSTIILQEHAPTLRELNERIAALSDQIIGLQVETISQRTEDTAPVSEPSQKNAESDLQNWEELRAAWKRNNDRLETIIKERLVGARQRKYDNYPRTNYALIIDRLFQDNVVSQTAHEKSLELHRLFMSYKPRNRPVNEEVIGIVRVLDQQLSLLLEDVKPRAVDTNMHAGAPAFPESNESSKPVGQDIVMAEGGDERRTRQPGAEN